MTSNVNIDNVSGETTLIKEETPSNTEHKILLPIEPTEDSNLQENLAKVPTQTHWTSNRRLSKGQQSAKQELTAKENDETITESQHFSKGSSKYAFFKPYFKAT